MLTGSIPPTGIPMPFVSAGGTSLSVFMGAMGILCNVSKMSGNEGLSVKQKIFQFNSRKQKIVFDK